MKQTQEQASHTEAILRVVTPQLGLFTITGSFEEVEDQNRILANEYHIPEVRHSTFNRVLAGGRARRLGLFGL